MWEMAGRLPSVRIASLNYYQSRRQNIIGVLQITKTLMRMGMLLMNVHGEYGCTPNISQIPNVTTPDSTNKGALVHITQFSDE